MAARITPEKIEQINELYLKLKVKKRVAEEMGISPSTVSKYIIPGYVAQSERKIEDFTVPPPGCGKLLDYIKNSEFAAGRAFAEYCNLSTEEWEDLKVLQKEVIV